MANELIFYKTPDGEQRIEVVYEDENFWMSQRALAELFSVQVPAISKHLKNIFESGELAEEQVVSILETTTQHGAIAGKTQTQKVKFYSLDAIIAVGYRVNSYQATQFRIWATQMLKEFIIKGFLLDDERLKQGKQFGQDYFDELLERIREIRASERRFYQKITDIYALSTDYDKNAPVTRDFFATLLDVIRNYVYLPDTSRKEEKILCRYPQYYAATKLYRNILQARPHRPTRRDRRMDTRATAFHSAQTAGRQRLRPGAGSSKMAKPLLCRTQALLPD